MNRKQRRESGKAKSAKRGEGKQSFAAPASGALIPGNVPFSDSGVSSLLVRNAGIQSNKNDPGRIVFLFSMARNHHRAGRLDQAEQIYRQILVLSARHAASLHLLGLIMHQRGHSGEALELISASLKENPKDAESQNNMGNVLRRLGRAPEAIAYFTNAVKLAPKFAGAYSNLGLTHRQLGQFPEAAGQFRKAIKHDPYLAEAWVGLARTSRLSLKDDEVKAAENVLKNNRLSDGDRRHMCFALGKNFDAVQQWDTAFRYYDRANALADTPPPDKGASLRRLKAILDHPFSPPKAMPASENSEKPDAQPIFIFGMPRSGSTLVEQILASHPGVSSCGELNAMELEIKRMFPELESGDVSVLENMSPARSDHLRDAFLNGVKASSGNKPTGPVYFTDKSLLNFVFLPCILSAFPGARLVHCRRSALDTCLSIYFTDFKATYDYTSDLGQIGEFYCHYHRIMEKWKAILPGCIFDIQYEDILDNQEKQTRQLLEYCGLTWDDACMRFFETDRQVSTPSDGQVRLPVFSSSRDRWKHYEAHLGSLFQSLGSCI